MVAETKYKKLEGKFTVVGLDLDTTGRRLIDEVRDCEIAVMASDDDLILIFLRLSTSLHTLQMINSRNTSCL